MPRYRRINIDGCSLFQTETRVSDSDLLPGTAVTISGGKFVAAADTTGRVYVVDIAHHQGLNITEANPAGDSVVANYVQDGREMAVLVAAGTYAKDDAITIGSGGKFAKGSPAIAYCQDDVTTTEQDFVRVRFLLNA